MNTYAFAPYRPLLFLGVGCVFSSCLIIYEWQSLNQKQTSPFSPIQLSISGLVRTANDSSPLKPLPAYQTMVNMPLFFAGREEVVAVTESADDGSLKLTGVVNTPEGFVALLQDKQGAHYKLNQGDEVKGWKVGSVQKDSVELLKNTASLELILFAARSKKDLTEQDLEACFKHKADLPLEECFKHPEKYARKEPDVNLS